MKFTSILLSTLLFSLLFNIGYSAEASGTSIIPVSPILSESYITTDDTAIPFTFYYTGAVANASCIFYLQNPTNTQAGYDFNCTVFNNTVTTFYPNATYTTVIGENWEWIVNCSIGCNNWSTWKDMDS